MKPTLLALSALFALVGAQAQVTSAVQWRLTGADGAVISTHTTQGACDTAARARAVTAPYSCPRFLSVTAPLPACTSPQPAAQTQAVACPSGTTGSWTQTNAYVAAPAPTCWVASAWLPTTVPDGACVTPPPPPPVTGALHFSDCQTGAAAGCVPGNNANPGTQASPKQNLSGVSVNTLPAGSQLLFARGGAWAGFTLSLHNLNATPSQPLVFDAYGSGAAPLLRTSSGTAFNVGGNWGNTTDDGGYTLRNLRLDGMGTAQWGVWLVQNVRDVTLDNVEITGFRIGVNSSRGSPYGVTGLAIRNSRISRNSEMGILGAYSDSVIEGTTFENNNFSGSGLNHAIYYSNGVRTVIRNNVFTNNSTVNGVCTGGNVTAHGVIDGLTIEGNRITQTAATATCYGFAITTGYTTTEEFRNVVIRGNTVVNVGMGGIAVNAAPGALVENNLVINTQATGQMGIWIGANGGSVAPDAADRDAIVRNNTVCYTQPSAGSVAISANVPGAQVSNNAVITGTAATTGACAL